MASNDFWTHVGLVTFSFLVVVGPRLFSPGHTVNSLIYIIGGTAVIAAAMVARNHTIQLEPEESATF